MTTFNNHVLYLEGFAKPSEEELKRFIASSNLLDSILLEYHNIIPQTTPPKYYHYKNNIYIVTNETELTNFFRTLLLDEPTDSLPCPLYLTEKNSNDFSKYYGKKC